MRKFLLFGIGLVLSSVVNAQNFTLDHGDSVKAAIGSDMTSMHNNVTNITSAPIKLTWKVISTNMTGTWTTPGVVGVCDNKLCYTNDATNSLLNGVNTYTSDDYAPAAPGDFHLQLAGLNGVAAGSAYISVSLTNGAQTDTATFVVTKWSTGVTNVTKVSDDVVLYPNPAQDQVNVLFDSKANIKNITLYNLIGKAMRVYRVSGNSAKLDIADIPSGIYFLRLQDAQGRVIATRKLTHQ